jgi:putative oxidoreductase
MRDLGLLLLRATLGGLLLGHGAQKLFGIFDGHGVKGTGQFFESMGLAPGEQWARTAGTSEIGGGLLTALGLLHPIGPIATLAPMIVAWGRAHADKPIWVTSGGAELPLTNITIATALIVTGPGAFSADRILGIRIPNALIALFAAATAGGALIALSQPRPEPQQQTQPQAQSASETAAPEATAAL